MIWLEYTLQMVCFMSVAIYTGWLSWWIDVCHMGKNGKYFYNAKLGYLHRYIMEKWYTKEILDTMTADNFVVDHMDGDGFNCNINNLCFLSRNENVAKGNTLDIECKNTEHIALKNV